MERNEKWLILASVVFVLFSGLFLVYDRPPINEKISITKQQAIDLAAKSAESSIRPSKQAKEFFAYFSREFDFALARKNLPKLCDVYLNEILYIDGKKIIIISTDEAAKNIIMPVPTKNLKDRKTTKILARKAAKYAVEFATTNNGKRKKS